MPENKKFIMTEKKYNTISSAISIFVLLFTLAVYMINIGFCLVDGNSMNPTMENGDAAMITVKGPKSVSYDDIVVLFPLDENSACIRNGFDFFKRSHIDKQIIFIKRVIGLPGDVIEIRDGYAWRNGEKLECPYTNGLTNGEFGPYLVEEGKIFCLGDNRDYSADSRSFGAFPMSGVVGKVLFHI